MFRAILLTVLCAVAGAANAGGIDLRATPVIEDLYEVVDIVNAGDGSNRLFLVQRGGQVRVVENGTLRQEPFLRFESRIVDFSGEQGLLSIAFPPGFAQKRYFYVWYTATDGDNELARVHLSADGRTGDPATTEVLLSILDPYVNHNGGKLLFGPDGYLYVSIGDGGDGGDPQNFAQNLNSLLGKILRLDTEAGVNPYRIPPDNPFAGVTAGRDEIWAYGLRNPWRMAFDPATGELYIGDVGQGQREEVNVQPAGAGGRNYGWRVFEGTRCFTTQGECNALTTATPPLVEYTHSLGCSITGGHVYRGTRYPALVGLYFYADYCSGRIWGLQRAGGGFSTQVMLDEGRNISTFGVDEGGDLYFADPSEGAVYLLSDGPPLAGFTVTGAITGSWLDPAQGGMGLFVEVLPNNVMVATWYTFGPNGGQAWIGGSGPITGDRAVINAFIPGGARFPPNFVPGNVVTAPWGTLTLTFTSCTTGTLQWNSTIQGYGSGSMPLQRLTNIAGLPCPPSTAVALPTSR